MAEDPSKRIKEFWAEIPVQMKTFWAPSETGRMFRLPPMKKPLAERLYGRTGCGVRTAAVA
jgi:hypothetical protein